MMIIQLFEFESFPIEKYKVPDYKNLPIGYFTCDPNRLKNLKEKNVLNLSGTFHFQPRRGDIRPETGDYFLAAFTYDRIRYLYISTLSLHGASKRGKITYKDSSLGLSKCIKQW